MHLSVVIPAFDEEQRIEETLREVAAYLSGQSYESEIIVVDDGSKDKTAAIVAAAFPDVRLISYRSNRGKGHAVKTGILAASGAYRLFYDADASTPIDELEKVWLCFENGAAIVIGSRALPDSDVQVHQAWYREAMGRIFNRLVRLFRLTDLPDTQCGFKVFTREACETVFPKQTVEHYSFDAELLFIAAKHGYRIDQVPVRWIDCPATHLRVFVDSLRMFWDLLVIRLNASKGKYD